MRGETGPTGGPAFTDLLGICTEWGEGWCVVAPESGAPVRIPLADIVSGKPVPPRPSVRHRVSVREAELRTAALFPGLETAYVGEWQLRAQPRPGAAVRRRANSCLAMGDPGAPFDEAVAAVRAFYAARDRSPLVNVEADSETEAAFRSHGWRPVPGDAHFLLASVARTRRLLPRSFAVAPARSVEGDRVCVTVAGRAEGQAAVDGDWVGLFGLTVEPAYRRQGLATAVLAELLAWAAEQGARTAWLHVETGNDAAIALYEGLGFETHHTYRYLAPGTRP